MIISKTPFRISFFGGGTDFPEYYLHNDNAGVISTTINKFCYISIRDLPKFYNHVHRISYSKIEEVKNVEEIQHPVIREILKLNNVKTGLEIHYDGDMPARSGLGSSSSFVVGFINAINALFKKQNDKKIIVSEALNFEQKVLKETVGSQDQINATFGGFNNITFSKNKNYTINKLEMSNDNIDYFRDSLLLLFSGVQRYASNIEEDKLKNMEKNFSILQDICEIKDHALNAFNSQNLNISIIGKLMDESWKLKKRLSKKVSLDFIDEAYNLSIENGALGGKILGAGGGGFLLLIAPKEIHSKIQEKLNGFLKIEFDFEYEGTKIIYNSAIK